MVGFISIGKPRPVSEKHIHDALTKYNGELYAIYLLNIAKRKGVSRRLYELARKEAMKRSKITNMLCWVLRENKTARYACSYVCNRHMLPMRA